MSNAFARMSTATARHRNYLALWRKGVHGTICELKIPLSHLEFIEPRSKVGSVWDIVPTLRTQSVSTNRQLIQLLFQLIE